MERRDGAKIANATVVVNDCMERREGTGEPNMQRIN
jgi:hypothetical protein